MRTPPAFALLCCALMSAAPAAELPNVRPNDNTARAGTLQDGVLAVDLYAAPGQWTAGADSAPPIVNPFLGEEGRPPTDPGPLLRMPIGTRVNLRFRNALADTVVLYVACKFPCKNADTLRVVPGDTARLRFTPRRVGTFMYFALLWRGGKVISEADNGSQLMGVMVVDDSGAPKPDRIIALQMYDHAWGPKDPLKGERLIFTFNGRAWPYTERFNYAVGDTVRWRVINLAPDEHPLHLHGFYFNVVSRGNGGVDRPIARAAQPRVVTENVTGFSTFEMVWSPDRAGNWLFHCHRPVHASSDRTDDLFERAHDTTGHAPMSMENHAMTGMGGLVLGVTVHPPSNAGPDVQPQGETVRRIRLVVKKVEHPVAPGDVYGYALPSADSANAPLHATTPGPVLALTRGERTAITVVNQIGEPTSVHWHGMELESYYDGVAGWSGSDARLAPLIAPADSFTALFTPRRAGTFIYHTHVNDVHQLTSGLYGPLIVLESGEKWDPETDHVVTIAQLGESWDVVNGDPSPQPITLKAGIKHRLRFINMTTDDMADVYLESDSARVSWTPVAKDAMPVVAASRKPAPARLHIGPGETYDFAFTPKPGDYRLRVMAFTNVLVSVLAR